MSEVRLIDANALKEVITANHYLLSAKNNSTDYGMFTVGMIQAIDNAPTVYTKNDCIMKKCTICPHCDNCDVDENGEVHNERPKGEWKDYSDEGYVECPFCGSATTCDDNKDELHYCWNCGSELR